MSERIKSELSRREAFSLRGLAAALSLVVAATEMTATDVSCSGSTLPELVRKNIVLCL
jgi:hypothetical protein